MWALPYVKRHYRTVEIQRKEVISGEREDAGDREIATVYFTRVGNTIPKPVEAFLKAYDFSEKTVMPVVTHGGSGAGKSVEDVKAICDGTVVENPLVIYCDDVPYCREQVTKWLETLMP